MKLLISIIVSTIFLLLCDKKFKKHSVIFYCVTVVLGVVTAVLPDTIFPDWINQLITNYITRGTLATALFVIVMYAVLIPNNSRFKKIFMRLRGEIAIVASLLILSHSFYYGKHYFVLLFTDAGSMSFTELVATIASLVMLLLMFPLTITSFLYIRKRMDAKKWKWLQRWSYLFYGLIYVHVVILFWKHIMLGELSYIIDLCIYTIIFLLYAVLRIQKTLQTRKKSKGANISLVAGTGIIIMFCTYIVVTGVNSNLSKEIETESNRKQVEEYKDGTWIGEGNGFNGAIKVEVIIIGGKISEVNVLESSDDYEYFTNAEATIPKTIIESQSVDVDVVSGATFSSQGIISAVNTALENSMK